MYRGFPASALGLLRCPRDGRPLHSALDAGHVLDGKVNCVDCDSSYRIESGILRLLDDNALDAESKGNLAVFSQNSASEGFDYETDLASLKDLLPTLEAMSPFEGKSVLEYGCGNGRFTVRISPTASVLVA